MQVVIILALFGLAACDLPGFLDYHNEVGVPLATKIWQAEQAINFDASRIVGGTPSNLGQFPYLGGLLITLTDGRRSVCGSSLISATRGLTAAHCWTHGNTQASLLEVVLGSTLLFSGGTRVETSDVVVHSGYNTFLHNDLAIIRFPYAVQFSDTVSPVRLPYGTLLNEDFSGWTAKATGFGRNTDSQAGIPNDQFQSDVRLEVIPNRRCRITFPFNVISSTICTSGDGGRSTCSGDSGGPLTVEVEGEDVLIGVVSFGHRAGCEIGHPAGFGRVTSHMTWINTNL